MLLVGHVWLKDYNTIQFIYNTIHLHLAITAGFHVKYNMSFFFSALSPYQIRFEARCDFYHPEKWSIDNL